MSCFIFEFSFLKHSIAHVSNGNGFSILNKAEYHSVSSVPTLAICRLVENLYISPRSSLKSQRPSHFYFVGVGNIAGVDGVGRKLLNSRLLSHLRIRNLSMHYLQRVHTLCSIMCMFDIRLLRSYNCVEVDLVGHCAH